MRAKAVYRILTREPLNYTLSRRAGSHRRLKAEGRPPITWAYHDSHTLSPGELRRVLVQQVGLEEDEALRLV